MRYTTLFATLAATVGCAPGYPPGHYVPSERILTSTHDLKFQATDGRSFGVALGAGDINGDGYDDLVAGAITDAAGGPGAVYTYFGGLSGIDPATEQKVIASDGEQGDGFGDAVAVADIDGDGFDDIVVGAPDDEAFRGSVYVYFGGPSGLDPTSEQKVAPSDGAPLDAFGVALSGAADVDGDGFEDFIVGARYHDPLGNGRGAAYVYYGSPTGVAPGREDKLTASDGTFDAELGRTVSGGEDIDGDGFADVMAGAAQTDGQGAAYVWFGSPSGPGRETRLDGFDVQAGGLFGISVAMVGDVDGDGLADVAVSDVKDDHAGPFSGAVYLFHGSGAGIDLGRTDKVVAGDAQPNQAFGSALYPAGDVDGDGLADLATYASGENGMISGPGAIYVTFGAGSGTGPALKVTSSDRETSDGFGTALASGDTDADGLDDLSVGAFGDDYARGSVYVYLGECVDEDGDGACNFTDCDDTNPDVRPDADETCNGLDDDCDGVVDGPDSVDAETWYPDVDGDGYSVDGDALTECVAPPGYGRESSIDCDDADPSVHPGAEEVPDDGIDQDCDGGDLASEKPESGGCGCSTPGPSWSWAWLPMLALVLVQRRR